MIYLGRIPKEFQGYLLGFGLLLTLLMQEKDSKNFKYALIPIIFNNMLLIVSQCFFRSSPVYVNSRMVAFGAIWYTMSIVGFVGEYHELFDFYYIFQDLTIFATGLSLFYSW